jgi:hypothetical protein
VISTEGKKFSFFKSYYVDDTAFLFLCRSDLDRAAKLIVSHFRRFGLTIHTGSRSAKESSKTEAMRFLINPKTTGAEDIPEDIEIDEDRFMSFCNKFVYLGSVFVPSLCDTTDIKARIGKARGLFYSMNKALLCNQSIPIRTRCHFYQAIVVNIVLWGCESWALKAEDRTRLERFHRHCLRRICNITMWDVKEKKITCTQLRKMAANSPSMESLMESRRLNWLSKVCNMDESRSPRRLLGAWCRTSRKASGPKQTIRHAYVTTLRRMSFGDYPDLKDVTLLARDKVEWKQRTDDYVRKLNCEI